MSLSVLQENRQFGSKMTDSKYFTTTKKGLFAYDLYIPPVIDVTVLCELFQYS